MYVYENELDVLKFWKKRFINIYPMFWIAYIFAMLFNFYRIGSIDTSIGKWRYIFSILGIDGYIANWGVQTFFLVGEWFLGYIIIIYIIFPILRKGVNEYPLLLAIITAVLYILSIVLGAKDVSLFVKLPEFLFGMYFIKFIKKPNLKMALISLVIVVINTLVKPDFISVVQCTYVGIASFVCLAYVSELLQFDIIQKICKVICKYSYPCFIVHHFIIYRMVEKFNLDNITMGQNYLLFACCIVVIAVFSYLLLHVNDKVVQLLKKEAK
ncbi:MAG: acyltransferase family protein [Agathobacter rectalis]|jgi:peptidoglycan/LPS O-acetylase OafA/YrhL